MMAVAFTLAFAHSLSEETQNPARVVPLAMLASVVAVSRRIAWDFALFLSTVIHTADLCYGLHRELTF